MNKWLVTLVMAWMVCSAYAQEDYRVYKQTQDGKDKYGIADGKGNAITPAKYDWIDQRYSEGFIMVYISELKTVDNSRLAFAPAKTGYYWAHHYGFLDDKGKELVPCKYDYAKQFNHGIAQVSLNNKWGYVNSQGREITPIKYDEIYERSFADADAFVRVYQVSENSQKKYGLLATSGKELTPPVYEEIKPFYEGMAVMIKNNMMGALNMEGKEVAAARYSKSGVEKFTEGMCRVNWNGKWGFIDKTGKEAVPLVYDRVNEFTKQGTATVTLNNKEGVIDKTGKIMVPAIYDRVYGFNSDGTTMVRLNDKAGRVDKTGRVVVPIMYGRVEPLSDGLFSVKQDTAYGWVDQTGKEVIPPVYGYGSSFLEGIAYVRVGKKFGAIDKSNRLRIPLQYEYISRLSDEKPLMYFKQGNKYGFFSETFTEITPAKYTRIYLPAQGRSFVRIDDKWGLINEKGKEIAEVKYDTLIATDVSPVVLAVADQKVGLLSNSGAVVIPVKYDNLFGFSDGLCAVLLNNKFGFVNEEGKEVIAPQFDDVANFINGKAQVRAGNQTFFIDKTGKKIE